MNRRAFVLKSSLATFGGILSLKSIGAAVNWISPLSMHIPVGGTHIRHGLFQPKPLAHNLLPDWLTVFERQVMFADGISQGKADLSTLSFHVGNEAFSIVQKGKRSTLGINKEWTQLKADQTFKTNKSSLRTLPTGIASVSGRSVLLVLKGSCAISNERYVEYDMVPMRHSMTKVVVHPDSIILEILRT